MKINVLRAIVLLLVVSSCSTSKTAYFDECGGKRFNDQVLSVKYCGKTILDILETPIIDIVNVFKESKKVCQTLSSMIELGLGYLKLGQMSMNLSVNSHAGCR